MNAAVLNFERTRRSVITTSSGRDPEAVEVFSIDFPTVTAMSSSDIRHESLRASVIHRLRFYVGAALAGSVACGLAFGWYEHRELVQWIGAAVGLLSYALVRRRLGA